MIIKHMMFIQVVIDCLVAMNRYRRIVVTKVWANCSALAGTYPSNTVGQKGSPGALHGRLSGRYLNVRRYFIHHISTHHQSPRVHANATCILPRRPHLQSHRNQTRRHQTKLLHQGSHWQGCSRLRTVRIS